MSAPDPLAVLSKAREVLTPARAWTQGRMCAGPADAPRCMCLIGALCFAANGNACDASGTIPAMNALNRGLGEEPNGSDLALVDWNDLRGRTHAEVLDLLDRTIAAAQVRP